MRSGKLCKQKAWYGLTWLVGMAEWILEPLASMHEALYPEALQRKKEETNLDQWLPTRLLCQVQTQCGFTGPLPMLLRGETISILHMGQREFRKAPCGKLKALAMKVTLLSHLAAVDFWSMNESIVMCVSTSGEQGFRVSWAAPQLLSWAHGRTLMDILSFFFPLNSLCSVSILWGIINHPAMI